MDLPAYLDWKKIKPIRAAEELDVTPATISRICDGKRRPSPELAKKLIAWSGNAITWADLYAERASA